MFPRLLHWVSKSHEKCFLRLTALINHREFTCYDANCDINVSWYVQKRVRLEFFVSHEAFRGLTGMWSHFIPKFKAQRNAG